MAGAIAGRRALVVGVPGKSIRADQGVRSAEHDVVTVAEMLDGRGFEVDIRTGRRATRDGILEGYDTLIEHAVADEAVVFYFSGHGFHSIATDGHPMRVMQGICPEDLSETTSHDFRGITSSELSIKLAQLTRRTKNVTLMFDCCYAAQMSRDIAGQGAESLGLPYPIHHGFGAYFDALKRRYPDDFHAVSALGTQDVVRLVACNQDGGAYAYEVAPGQRGGAFTKAVLDVLREAGDAGLSWASMEDAIRGRVQSNCVDQRPSIGGAKQRRPFTMKVSPANPDAAVLVVMGDDHEIEAGDLHGVTKGDLYAVMPSGSEAHQPQRAIAELRVERVSATRSHARIETWRNGNSAVPGHAVAIAIERLASRQAVAVKVPASVHPAVARAIKATRNLRVAEPSEGSVLATLRVVGNDLTIEDPGGALRPTTRFPAELPAAIDWLANRAAAQRLRGLEGEHGVLADEVEIEWGTVEHHQPQPMPEHGASLGLGDRIYVRVRSRVNRRLYLHIFNVGIDDCITSLITYAPAGLELRPAAPEATLGQEFNGDLTGLALSWPIDIPRDELPRRDEVVVVVTSAQANLAVLDTGVARGTATRSAGSKLQDLIAQVQDGLPRSTRGETHVDGFLVRRLSFLLHGRNSAMAIAPFAVDHNAFARAASRTSDAWLPAIDAAAASARSEVIAIEINAAVAACCQAVPADLRIDALVCTRRARRPGYETWTATNVGVACGGALTFPDPTVFRGRVQDFVEIAIWVSTTADRRPLAELLRTRAGSPEFRDAAGTLAITAETTHLPWVAGVGGSAVLVRIVREVLLGKTGNAIGLWRTCFVADDQFGIGRHAIDAPAGAVTGGTGAIDPVHVALTIHQSDEAERRG
jgi:hypothetical protein